MSIFDRRRQAASSSGSVALRRLARDERGATIVEFALVAGSMIALTIAILQVSLTYFVQQNLETTTEKAVRQLLTGAAQANGTTQSQFKSLVCSKLPAFLKCANVMIDVRVASSFASADTTAPTLTFDSSGNPNNSFSYQPGVAGEITVARIMYIWDVQKGPLGFDLSTMSRGRRLLLATSVFKTEPRG